MSTTPTKSKILKGYPSLNLMKKIFDFVDDLFFGLDIENVKYEKENILQFLMEKVEDLVRGGKSIPSSVEIAIKEFGDKESFCETFKFQSGFTTPSSDDTCPSFLLPDKVSFEDLNVLSDYELHKLFSSFENHVLLSKAFRIVCVEFKERCFRNLSLKRLSLIYEAEKKASLEEIAEEQREVFLHALELHKKGEIHLFPKSILIDRKHIKFLNCSIALIIDMKQKDAQKGKLSDTYLDNCLSTLQQIREDVHQNGARLLKRNEYMLLNDHFDCLQSS